MLGRGWTRRAELIAAFGVPLLGLLGYLVWYLLGIGWGIYGAHFQPHCVLLCVFDADTWLVATTPASSP